MARKDQVALEELLELKRAVLERDERKVLQDFTRHLKLTGYKQGTIGVYKKYVVEFLNTPPEQVETMLLQNANRVAALKTFRRFFVLNYQEAPVEHISNYVKIPELERQLNRMISKVLLEGQEPSLEEIERLVNLAEKVVHEQETKLRALRRKIEYLRGYLKEQKQD